MKHASIQLLESVSKIIWSQNPIQCYLKKYMPYWSEFFQQISYYFKAERQTGISLPLTVEEKDAQTKNYL